LRRTAVDLRGRTQEPATRTRRIRVGVVFVCDDLRIVDLTIPNWTWRIACWRCERTVLLPNQCGPVNPDRADGFRARVPIAVRRGDCEVLLAGILHWVFRHTVVDAVGLPGIVSPNTGQRLASRRRPARHLRKELAEPVSALRGVEVTNGQVVRRVDGSSASERRCRQNRQEANPVAVVKRRECQADRTLCEVDTRTVVGVPNGEVLTFIRHPRPRCCTDRYAHPVARHARWACRRCFADARVYIGTRCCCWQESLATAMHVVISRLRGIRTDRILTSRVVECLERAREINEGAARIESVVSSGGETWRREVRAVGLLG
jgi:hypothetical protein